jgi:PPOX class probable F420-dependent enzyme
VPSDSDLLAIFGDRGNAALVTIRPDGRPQLSNVSYAFDSARFRISITDTRVKTRNLRHDPRATLYRNSPEGWRYTVVEGIAALTPEAEHPEDDTVNALVDLYRAIGGEHPDWDDYRRAMVADRRLVLTVPVDHVYGQ